MDFPYYKSNAHMRVRVEGEGGLRAANSAMTSEGESSAEPSVTFSFKEECDSVRWV